MDRASPDPALIGQVLDGRYRLDALLGHGGMGAVYRGTHIHLETVVAIKVMRPHLAADATAARRFAREAKGTFVLDTEHAIKVADFGFSEAGLLYMVMELLDGRTVHDELGVDGPLAPSRAVRVAAQMCDALAAAHRRGFLHRDIKPENVMLIRRGADPDFVKVLDFGLAKLIDGSAGAPFSVAALTQKDIVFGTPEYMAPEQAMGHTLDPRTDLYAVGATLFEMLTGRPPFVETSPMRLLAHHVKTAPPGLREVAPTLSVTDALEALMRRCLAKRPDDRPASAEALATALRALADSQGNAATRVPAALAASATVDVDAVPSEPPVVQAPTVPARPRSLPSTGTEMVSTRGLRRGTRFTIGVIAVLVLGLGAVVAIAMTRKRASGSGSRSASVSEPIKDAGVPEVIPIDATPVADARSVEIPIDAAPPRKASGTDVSHEVDAVLARHLAAAESARRSKNRLRQLAEADAALERAPKHTRARFLMGEALLETGDAANGCKYLRSAKSMGDARAILSSGRCPVD